MDKKLGDYFVEKLMNFALANGVPVSQQIKEKRLAICNTCPKRVVQKIKPALPACQCCKVCGCALFTKASYESIPRKKGTPPEQLITVDELLNLQKDEFFNLEDYVQTPIGCPHPDGDKWAGL